MENNTSLSNHSAARMVASMIGVLAGLGGRVHGIGETLQGNIAPNGLIIPSWTKGTIATNMGGELAMTIISNLFIADIRTILVSLAIMVWAAMFVQRKNGGRILIFLSVILLLVGGGFAPSIIGLLAGVSGTRINVSSFWWRTHLPNNVRDFLAKLWPWIFGICLLNGVFLVVGSLILVYFFNLNNPDLFVNSFFFAIISLLLTILTGVAYDLQMEEQHGEITD